jgi:hypothetical protein
MSWSRSYDSRENFANDVPQYPSPIATGDGVQEQIATARAAAQQVIDSGVVGGTDKDFSVNLSGHSNPGHEPAPSWANDCLTISINQKSPPAA